MHELFSIIAHHWIRVAFAILGYLAFDAAAENLPQPSALSKPWQVFLVGTIHAFALRITGALKIFRSLVGKRFGVEV